MLLTKDVALWKYLVENPSILKNFLKHIDNRSIADIVLKLLINENTASNTFKENDSRNNDTSSDIYLENKKKLIDEIFKIYE